MEATLSQSNWQHPNQLEHWLKHSILPVLLIALLLLIPKPWQSQYFTTSSIIIELSKETTSETVIPEEVIPEAIKPEEIIPDKPIMEELLETPQPVVEKIQPAIQQPEPIIKSKIAPKPSQPLESITAQEPKINSTDVLQMLQNRPSMELTSDFLPRTAPAKDFYIPEQQIMDWYADIPFLDESIDKPKLQMRFYPEGFEGSIERFFDKVTYTKTFTTKYGTKIHCALIAGILAACSWK